MVNRNFYKTYGNKENYPEVFNRPNVRGKADIQLSSLFGHNENFS